MDLLKRTLAPVPSEAWAEIDDRAEEVLTTQLAARRVLHVDGPHGPETTTVPTGRIDIIKKGDKGAIGAGVYGAQPLLESRIRFDLSRWELDNILHGEKDVELDALEDAAEKIALFEEDVIYNGYQKAGIKGLTQLAGTTMTLGEKPGEILKSIASGVLAIEDAYAEKPYDLIVGDEVYKKLSQSHPGGVLRVAVENVIGGRVIRSKALEGALLMPYDHEDLELTVGQDYAVGYSAHDGENVELFLTNAFTFRCLDEAIIVYYK